MGAAECARRTGLTVRALRVYERHGLIEPPRTGKGWRSYGPRELQRINVIVTLKAFGMTLERMRELFATEPPPLTNALQLQLQACTSRRAAADNAIGLIKTALSTLESGKELSLDSLCSLTRSMEMDCQHSMFQAVREQINEIITPEEERAVMTWIASRSADELKAMRESAPAVRVVRDSLHELLKRKIEPADPELQTLVLRNNELAVRYGLQKYTADMIEWNTPLAIKWMQMGARAMSRFRSAQAAAPDEKLSEYLHAAQIASKPYLALEPLVEEAAGLADRNTSPTAASSRALVVRLRQLCGEYSLADPLTHARWARAITFRWPAEDNSRRQAGWAFLIAAVRAATPADEVPVGQ